MQPPTLSLSFGESALPGSQSWPPAVGEDIYIYIYIHTHTHIRTHTYIYAYIYIYMYTYIDIYKGFIPCFMFIHQVIQGNNLKLIENKRMFSFKGACICI